MPPSALSQPLLRRFPLLRRAGEVPNQVTQAPRSTDVPLWTFLVMTVFALILMCCVVFLLWRPDLGFYLSFSKERRRQRQRQQQQQEEKQYQHQQHSGMQKGEEQQPQPQLQLLRRHPSQSSNSGHRHWFRGGSLRRDIDRWRRGVQNRESLHSEPPAAADPDDHVLAVVEAYRFAPHVAPRPISHLDEIPEYPHVDGGGGGGINAMMPVPMAVTRTAAAAAPDQMWSPQMGPGRG